MYISNLGFSYVHKPSLDGDETHVDVVTLGPLCRLGVSLSAQRPDLNTFHLLEYLPRSLEDSQMCPDRKALSQSIRKKQPIRAWCDWEGRQASVPEIQGESVPL